MTAIDRRAVLAGLSAAAAAPARPARAAGDALAAIERRSGGRLGVFALDTGSGRSLAHRADERVLMCSTTKLALVAALLARVDAGAERLDRRIPYTMADLAGLGYEPDTATHVAQGGMTLEALCAAAIEHSDNGAANLLFAAVGGPAAVQRFARALGDGVTRFDRTEPTLNCPEGDEDTTTPRAYVGLTRAVVLGDALRPASRGALDGWLRACTTGLTRIRAGIPVGWAACDKTGTSDVLSADVAVLHPPGGAAIVVAAYVDAPGRTGSERDAALRDVGAAVAAGLAAG